MKVMYRLLAQSYPVIIEEVIKTFQQGDFYCMLKYDETGKKVVRKIPIALIFDIVEG